MNKLIAFVAAGALACASTAFGQATKAPEAPPKASTAAPAPAAPAAPAPAPTAKAPDAKMAATPPANSQQDKMKTCNDQAGDKKGDDRKAFMKTCLSAKPAKPESRMAMCNKKTAGMAKEERSKAQSECMKG